MLSILLLALACTPLGSKGNGGSTGDDTDTGTAPVVPQPLDVTGWGTDLAIAGSDGTTQGEPAAIALADGTLVVSWMETMDDGYTLYVVHTRSTDGGLTWSTPETFDEDRWGWQNDPHFVYADGRLYYTWLAVESTDGSRTAVYCEESADEGVTWSDKVKLSTESTDVDREWMATDGVDHVVITWDSFSGSSEAQEFAESYTGCSGFSTPTKVAAGTMLNGVPAIDTDGNIWAARSKYNRSSVSNVISELVDGDWVDQTVQTYDYPSGAYYAMFAEHDEDSDHHRDADEHPTAPAGIDLVWHRFRAARGFNDLTPPVETASGTYTGEYSPILAASPNGGLAVVTLGTEDGNDKYGDVSFYRIIDGVASDPILLNQDGGGSPQMEPWVAVDQAGGIHATWYDGRESAWRLYSANSVDDGLTFNELPVGDNTFTKGFDETTASDFNAWVGHFQSIVTTDDHVLAVFGDSHTHNVSRIYVDSSVGE